MPLDYIGPAINLLCSLKTFLKHLYLTDAVQAKRPVVLTQAAVSDEIPVPIPSHYAVRLDLTVGQLVMSGTIVHGDPLALSDRLAERNHERDIGSCFLFGREEEQVRGYAIETVPYMLREDAGDFRERPFNGHR